jgi:hypothetical protein
MKWTILGIAILVTLWIVTAVQTSCYYVVLPERVASEFDLAGNAGGTMSREGFVLMHWGLILIISLCIPLVAVSPDWMIDMPNKHYWFAPERRRQSRRWLLCWCLWFANATLLFLTVVMELCYRANCRPVPDMGFGIWIPLAAYLACVAVMMVPYVRRFRRIPAAEM